MFLDIVLGIIVFPSKKYLFSQWKIIVFVFLFRKKDPDRVSKENYWNETELKDF